MKMQLSYCALGALLMLSASAQPKVTALTNNYSGIKPGLPNYGIASGSIFVIWGVGIGPATPTTLQSAPLNPTFGGVTVMVTGSDGKTYQAISYFASASQVDAILPSATPAGKGTITVTYNGQSSAAFPIQVVASAFGLMTLNNGTGPAAGYDANYQYLGLTNALNAGEYAILWGTGLGASSDSDTETNTKYTDIRGATKVWIGGQSAKISYAGRSAYPGLDQINVQVPAGVSGCYVSVVVESGAMVSNTGSIALAASGRTCSDPNGLSSSDLSVLTGKSADLGFISVGRAITHTAAFAANGVTVLPASTVTKDYADADFYKYTADQIARSSGLFTQASYGSCMITTFSGTSFTAVVDPVQPAPLDAGSAITMNTPAGTFSLPHGTQYPYYSLSSNSSFITDAGGTFTFGGPGGADVGKFTSSIALGAPLTWNELSTIATVDRTQGVTVTWKNGDANSSVKISGFSSYLPDPANKNTATSVYFTCTAPISAQSFTVPSPVLLALPPTGTINEGGTTYAFPGYLMVSNYTSALKFAASGIDVGYAFGYYTNATSVTYK